MNHDRRGFLVIKIAARELHCEDRPAKLTPMDLPVPIYVCGPTASGKSSLALRLAEKYQGEIVNADAFQLYRGLEIVSAAPDAADFARAPHHLYGVLAPSASADAGSYHRMARPLVDQLITKGITPIVTGGSGLYLKFLTHGPSPLPTGDSKLRAELDSLPLEELVRQLHVLDPVEAARTALENRRFVSRALEICLLTGERASALRDQWHEKTQDIATTLRGILIQRPRAELHQRIGQRTRQMLEQGATEEVARLADVSPNLEKAIGFREIRALLAGEIDSATCEEQINAATRQYAKRQESWFRRETWLRPFRPNEDELPEW